jgi:predicted PurR-regulated permease PerM
VDTKKIREQLKAAKEYELILLEAPGSVKLEQPFAIKLQVGIEYLLILFSFFSRFLSFSLSLTFLSFFLFFLLRDDKIRRE